jgi:hypothetical protein
MAREDTKTTADARLRLDLNGDRRLAEQVILEVRAAAERLGVEIASVAVAVAPKSTIGRKAGKTPSGRKLRARA